MTSVLLVPFAMQAFLMGVDELYFHRRRGLPRWERLGHPIDTASVLICLLIAGFAPFEPRFAGWYAAAAITSCLLITKDEFVHAGRCTPGEHWVHALLFVLHPVILYSAGVIWAASVSIDAARTVLRLEAAAVGLVFIYQLVYWNFWRVE